MPRARNRGYDLLAEPVELSGMEQASVDPSFRDLMCQLHTDLRKHIGLREKTVERPRQRRCRGLVADDEQRVLSYFPRLGERGSQRAGSLSGGEQQMLALARGFLTRPDLMLIDELSGGLMPMLVDALMEILQRINRDGVTILLVEQELEVAVALASRCYVLDQGRIQFEGPDEALRRDHEVQARFLGAS